MTRKQNAKKQKRESRTRRNRITILLKDTGDYSLAMVVDGECH